MKKYMRILQSLLINVLIFSSLPAFAGFQVGLSTNYLKINDGYERNSSLSSPTINIGYNYVYGDFVLTANTNRLFNKTQR